MTSIWQASTSTGTRASVYNWFTEGFDTKDLGDARAFLEALESARSLASLVR
jgi:hypothetical protein